VKTKGKEKLKRKRKKAILAVSAGVKGFTKRFINNGKQSRRKQQEEIQSRFPHSSTLNLKREN
jgi:hypothetical protein